MAMYTKGEAVALWTGVGDDDWVPAVVSNVASVSPPEYFVTAFPGESRDNDSLQENASVVGPIGEGDHERYAVSAIPTTGDDE